MRTVTTRILLPLTVLVAGPLMGWGGFARAGYVAPESQVAAPHADGVMNANGAETAAMPADPRGDDGPAQIRSPWGSLSALLNAGAPSTGASGQPTPGGPGAGASGPQPSLVSRPQTDPPAVAGVLFLEEVQLRLPPFPSRLFRPPRVATMLVS
ncbi:MAG TPA: hypothetical protein VMS17_33355 [Gemmataceae bacterium]|nr:hypothetical protein [Gemmataceae bacterium]